MKLTGLFRSKESAKAKAINFILIIQFINAAAAGRVTIGSMLLENGAKVNIHGPTGLTPLMFAALGNPEMVDLLLRNGADVNARDDNGNTALICASGFFKTSWETSDGARQTLESASGDKEIVKRLIEAGAELKNHYDYTALDYAAEEKHREIEQLIKSHKK